MKTASRSASDAARPALRHPAAVLALALACGVCAFASGSLWPTDGGPARSMFADRKAARKGDILTVVVAESAAATNSQSKKTSRESSIEDAVGRFLFSAAASGFATRRGELPGTKFAGKGTNSGGGEVANTQSLTSRAAVLVVDVLPNGNLVIEGVRVVTFSGETQYVVLHGLVRPDDVSSANAVFSTNIADARIEFLAEGNLTEAQKRGWLTKLYDQLRPF
jgi:flagellar L-ring protein precursor FlgH